MHSPHSNGQHSSAVNGNGLLLSLRLHSGEVSESGTLEIKPACFHHRRHRIRDNPPKPAKLKRVGSGTVVWIRSGCRIKAARHSGHSRELANGYWGDA